MRNSFIFLLFFIAAAQSCKRIEEVTATAGAGGSSIEGGSYTDPLGMQVSTISDQIKSGTLGRSKVPTWFGTSAVNLTFTAIFTSRLDYDQCHRPIEKWMGTKING